jgi:Mn2+/Fe2+ NRAMP family transporter
VLLAALILAMLAEMSGRLAAVGKHTVSGAVRERFGFHFHLVPVVGELMIDLLLLTAEIGGIAVALRLATDVAFQWWILPEVWWYGSSCGWAILMSSSGVGLLGLSTLAFVVAAWSLQPPPGDLAAGLVPSLP